MGTTHDLERGTRVTITTEGPLGVFDRECWDARDGRILSRVWFDSDMTVTAGDSGTIQGRDHTTEDGWYVVAFGDYVAPLHESMFETDTGETL
jgi:hypothetical protein